MEHSDRGILEYDGSPEPEIDPDEVLVDVKAAPFNHLDIWTRQGLPSTGLEMPHVPGGDMADVVTEVDKRAIRFKASDRVVLVAGIAGGGDEFFRKGDPTPAPDFHIVGEYVRGIHAKSATIPEENLVLVPKGVPWEVAGSALLIFQTTWRMLVDRGEFHPGEKVLVLGVSDGVGHAAAQIVDYTGAEMYATASTSEKLEYAEECSTDHVVNYEEDDFSKEIQTFTDGHGVDIVVDHIGEATYKQSPRSLAKDGRAVTYGAAIGLDPGMGLNYIFWNQLPVIGSTMATPDEADEVLGLVWNGAFESRICEALPINKINRAYELVEERQGFGKVTVIPDSEL